MSTTLFAVVGCAASTSAVVTGTALTTAVVTHAAILENMTPDQREAYIHSGEETYLKMIDDHKRMINEAREKRNAEKVSWFWNWRRT